MHKILVDLLKSKTIQHGSYYAQINRNSPHSENTITTDKK